jgi:4-hydroxymandelate oxidase
MGATGSAPGAPAGSDLPPIDLARLEELARDRLEPPAWEYVSSAAGDSAQANARAWRELRFRPQVLRDVSAVSTGVALLGASSPLPLLVAPTAMHRLACDDGELATARAAARCGVTFVVSTMATTAIEDIAAAAPGAPRWMQVYVYRDRGRSRAMVERAAAAGCTAIVLTVDSPGIPRAPRPRQSSLNAGLPLPNLAPGAADPDVLAMASDYAADLTFEDLADVRSWTGLPLVVKGVMRGDDARRCIDGGADAITVSNHGGRQVPGCLPTAVALEDVVEAVGDGGEVYVDGGVRSGADVLRALALGATAVMVGRPVWWGLGVAGEAGAHGVLQAYAEELRRTMALCGVRDATEVPRDLVCRQPRAASPGA